MHIKSLRKRYMFKDLLVYINIKNPLFRFFMWLSFFGFVALADLIIPTTNVAARNEYIVKFIFTFLTSGGVFYLIRYGFGVKAANPFNFLVSTWIVFLLIHPTNSFWMFPFAVLAIAIGKFLFKRNRQPIFNPAALAILLTYLVAKIITIGNPNADTLLVSWWGADMFQNITQEIPIVNVVVPVLFLGTFLFTTTLFKKTTYALSFLITFLISSFVYMFFTSSLESATNFVSLALFNATAFAALVMIPEPKTSPVFPNQQLIVGIIGGLLLLFFNTVLTAFPIDPLINTILVTNLVVLIIKMQKPKTKSPAPAPQPTQTVPPQQPVNQNIRTIA